MKWGNIPHGFEYYDCISSKRWQNTWNHTTFVQYTFLEWILPAAYNPHLLLSKIFIGNEFLTMIYLISRGLPCTICKHFLHCSSVHCICKVWDSYVTHYKVDWRGILRIWKMSVNTIYLLEVQTNVCGIWKYKGLSITSCFRVKTCAKKNNRRNLANVHKDK